MILLEQLFDNSPSARNFQKLAQIVPDTGGRSVGYRFGQVTCTWPGGNQQTNAPTVMHGLGRTPVDVQLTVISTPVDAWAWANSVDDDSFLLSVKTSSAAPAGATTCTVSWRVEG